MSDTIILEQKAGAKASKRERLYIFPSRHGLLYAAMLAVMLLGAINYTNNMAYMLTFMLAGLFMVCMLHTYRNLRGLAVSVSEARPVFAGDLAQFPVVFDNRGGPERAHIRVAVRPPRKKYTTALDCARIGAGHLRRDFVPVRTDARGYQDVGRLKIYSGFPLGLFEVWFSLDSRSRCVVYPKPQGDPALPDMIEDTTRDQSGRLAGTDDFTGVRRYHTGDSIRNVDWKAYARERGLLVKKFSGSGARKLVLHWDRTARLGDTESRLSQLALWVVRAERDGVHYGMVLPDVQIAPGHGEMHRHLCLRQLALYGQDLDR